MCMCVYVGCVHHPVPKEELFAYRAVVVVVVVVGGGFSYSAFNYSGLN